MAHSINSHPVVELLQRTNQIAASIDLDTMLTQMLDLIGTLTNAHSVAVYLYQSSSDALICTHCHGDGKSQDVNGQEPPDPQAVIQRVFDGQQPVCIADEHAIEWPRAAVNELQPVPGHITCLVPLQFSNKRPIGLLRLSQMPRPAMRNGNTDTLELVQLVADRLATEIDKSRLLTEQTHFLHAAHHREQQLEALIDFISRISTTLEREKLIRIIMGYAEELLGVETTSFWLLNEHGDRLELLVAGGDTSERMKGVSVAVGEGIIGHVVQTGQRKVVNDVSQEPLFNRRIDLERAFETRSILSVPMRAPRIQRGDIRGEIQETIIGGAQALNKRDGSPFNDDDIRCFETLTRQAAIAFQLSHLFEEDYVLFWGVIKATTSAIDFTDPYARGHSARVSDFSVAIAEELGMSQKEIYHIRVGSMLHDVGKIGVSPDVLRKPGRPTPKEFEQIQKHPTYGVELLQEAGLGKLLEEELKALAQHHERLDGHGYPYGLQGDEIAHIARIVAVADVFDALTSDRPYRSALTVEQAFDVLEKIAGTELDSDCVAALIQARMRGKVLVQHERRILGYERF